MYLSVYENEHKQEHKHGLGLGHEHGQGQRQVYRRESNLAISSSPVTNNNVQFILRCTAIVWKIEEKIILAVRQVSA
jgi:hypothetical protein